jgi:hypothetical protein
MKNSVRIKVIKRHRTPARLLETSNADVKRETFSEKNAERNLANQVNDWVHDLREKKRAEEKHLLFNFFPHEAIG